MPATKTVRRTVSVRTIRGLRMNAFGKPCLVVSLTDRLAKGQFVRIAGETQVYKLTCGLAIDHANKTERFEAVVVKM